LFSWLHLSDLHFGHGDKTYGWDQKTVLSLLLQDVRKALTDWPELPRPQAILLTGDIAFSGGTISGSEYHDAQKFLADLVEILKIDRDKVFLVPGNHDVQRDVAKILVERVRTDPGELDSILDSRKQRAQLFNRQGNFKRFADAFARRDLDGWIHSIAVPDFGDITLVGLNTALVSNDDLDQGKLILAGKQRNLLSTAKGRVRLLLTHHPFEGGWLNDESSLRSTAEGRIAMHLCGHMHDPRVDLVSRAGGDHHIRVVAAAAHRDPKESKAGKDSHGYNFASLMLDAKGTLQLRTWPRRWFPTWSSFRVDHLGVPDRGFYDDKSLREQQKGSGEQLKGSGLVLEGPDTVRVVGVHWWGHPQVRWDELLHDKSNLEVFGIAVRELFGQPNSEYVKALLNRGGSVHVVLADPRAKTSVARYDEDFDTPVGDRYQKVVEVLKLLKGLQTQIKHPARLRVHLTRYTFKYSAYRIDGDVLFVPYRMIPGKQTTHTPALVFDRGSSVVKRFLGPELDELLKKSEPTTPKLLREIVGTK